MSAFSCTRVYIGVSTNSKYIYKGVGLRLQYIYWVNYSQGEGSRFKHVWSTLQKYQVYNIQLKEITVLERP